MASFSCRISPRTSTVILRDKSPLATAVATSAMFRTWPVRLLAIELTLSVRSFQVPATSGHLRLSAEFAFRSDFAGHARHFGGEHAELLNHRVDDVGGPQKLAFQRTTIHVQPHGLGEIPCATAAIARVTSVVGRSRSSISVLTETSISPQAPRDSWKRVRSRVLPCLPTTCPTRFNSCAMCWLAATISLNVSATFPGKPNPSARQAHGEIAVAHGLQAGQNHSEVQRSVRDFGLAVIFRKSRRRILGTVWAVFR